jgi:hypothetical protein
MRRERKFCWGFSVEDWCDLSWNLPLGVAGHMG